MDALPVTAGRVRAKLGLAQIFTVEVAAARLSPGNVRSVLFSESYPAWQQQLRRTCAAAGYRATFGPLDAQRMENSDLVMPLSVTDVRMLARSPGLVEGNPIPIPSTTAIDLCDDKREFADTLIRKGFGDHVPSISGRPDFPYMVKKTEDESSVHSYLVHDRAQERAMAEQLNDPDYFTQAFIPGEWEYTTHLVIRERRVVSSLEIGYVYASRTPIKFKERILYKTVRRSPYLELFAAVLVAVGFEGLCSVNYKEYQGRPWIIEVNPRMGGSLVSLFFSFLKHL